MYENKKFEPGLAKEDCTLQFYVCTPLKTVSENGIGYDRNFEIMQN